MKKQYSTQASHMIEQMSMINNAWIARLKKLAERFSHLGIATDMPAMTLDELWGLYRFLSRLDDAGGL